MEKFGTFYSFSNDRINITLIWVWFSNKVLNIEKMKKLTQVILKLECLFYHNIYILFYLILYSKSHFDSNKCKKRSNRKKNTPYRYYKKFGNKDILSE
jgi:hypothetical protein